MIAGSSAVRLIRISFLLLLGSWLNVLPLRGQGEGTLVQRFEQARARHDHRSALAIARQLMEDADAYPVLLAEPDFFRLAQLRQSLQGPDSSAAHTLLDLQTLLLEADPRGGWVAERAYTALLYRPWIGARLMLVLRPALERPPAFVLLEQAASALVEAVADSQRRLVVPLADYARVDQWLLAAPLLYPQEAAAAAHWRQRLAMTFQAVLPGCDELRETYTAPLFRQSLRPSQYPSLYLTVSLNGCVADAFRDSLLSGLVARAPDPYYLRLAAAEYLDRGEYAAAQRCLEEALTFGSEPRLRAGDALALARVFRLRRNFRSARLYALQADELYPEWGEPWLFLAEMVTQAGPFCRFSPLERKALFWLGIDYCERAMAQNPELKARANRMLARYRTQMPTAEEVAFHGFEAGDRFPLPCWIGEVARVRIP
jgi:hypothetical protein